MHRVVAAAVCWLLVPLSAEAGLDYPVAKYTITDIMGTAFVRQRNSASDPGAMDLYDDADHWTTMKISAVDWWISDHFAAGIAFGSFYGLSGRQRPFVLLTSGRLSGRVPVNGHLAFFARLAAGRNYDAVIKAWSYHVGPSAGIEVAVLALSSKDGRIFPVYAYLELGGFWSRFETNELEVTSDGRILGIDRHRDTTAVLLSLGVGGGGV